jgi:hypothetical protein
VSGETDLALRVLVAERCAEAVGAVLMDLLGPFQEEKVDGWSGDAVAREPGNAARTVALVFYQGPTRRSPTKRCWRRSPLTCGPLDRCWSNAGPLPVTGRRAGRTTFIPSWSAG